MWSTSPPSLMAGHRLPATVVAVPTSRDLPVSFERLVTRTTLWLAVANAAGAVTVFVYLAFVQGNAQGLAASPRDTRVSLLLFVVYVVAIGPLAVYTGYRNFAPVMRWLSEDRPPTADEQRIVLSQPLRHTAWAFLYWVGAAILFGIVLQFWFGNTAEQMVSVTLGILLGGLATCSLSFLFVERTLRPLFAFALQSGQSDNWTAAFVVTLRGRSEPTRVYRPKVGKGAPSGDGPGGAHGPARSPAGPSGRAG
jgi:hypothetical protein